MHRRAPRKTILTGTGQAAVLLLSILPGAFLLWAGREPLVLGELVSAPPAAPVQLQAPSPPAQQ